MRTPPTTTRLTVYLKRSKSADDFDLVKTTSFDNSDSNPEDSIDQERLFGIEKAKSVRKATTQFAD